ncbi:hypothetical protein QAD02_015179 [Eretmocerus hayati]|uniref:Uncharacterized protein n=1 Tax=Eretmocerus hayati TaxID=131215 RepID=A0ACC2PAB2_9HYME|nr:hypothetical protein QAD02_015179 [Eretmocerus hayati]
MHFIVNRRSFVDVGRLLGAGRLRSWRQAETTTEIIGNHRAAAGAASLQSLHNSSDCGAPATEQHERVYEVFVKDDGSSTEGAPRKPEISVISSTTSQNQQLLQANSALDLDSLDVISADGDAEEDDDTATAVSQLLETESEDQPVRDALEKKGTSNRPPARTSTNRLIDKDDPQARLHYVKYLQRDGKTLKIWECGICSKEFRHQYTLMRHLPTHTDERNFKCDICSKAFRQLSTLSQHKAIHSDARPYVCEFCKKTFNRVSTLISHRKTHSEHKPHKCHVCGKGFHQKGNLRNHIFTHTNERPYKCDICGKGFNQMSNLVCHKVKAHAHAEKMQYACGICGEEFPRRFSLRAHEEYNHGIKYRQTTHTQSTSQETRSSKKKNVRVAHTSEDEQQSSSDLHDENLTMTEFMENIIIDKITTSAMEAALLQDQTPFALFKPAKGIPVLVKVTPSGCSNHLLTPATADDLKMSGKMDPNSTSLSDVDGSKSIQIKVPVVATVTEKIDDEGKITFIIEPPGPDQDQDSVLTPVDSVTEILPCDDGDDDDDDDDDYPRAPAFNSLPSLDSLCDTSTTGASNSSSGGLTTDDELLELAAIGGIQFVRETEDGRYEVMTNNEARELMAQNSHDVKILNSNDASISGVINVMNAGTNQCDMPNIYNHPRSDIPMVPNPSSYNRNMPPQQQQQQIFPLPTIPESMPFLKNSQSFGDEMGNVFEEELPLAIDYSSSLPEYNPRMKLSEFEDDLESIFLTLGQHGAKVVTQKIPGMQPLDGMSERHIDDRNIGWTTENPMKLLEDKSSPMDLSSQLEDFKFLNNYDQFLKNPMFDSHFPGFNSLPTSLNPFVPDLFKSE